MSDENKVINFKRNSAGDLMFEMNPQYIRVTSIIKALLSVFLTITLPVFAFFDFLASKRKLVISSVGLGIGLGLSVLVTQRPDTLQAFPYLATSGTKIAVAQLLIPSIDFSSQVISGSVQNIFENAAMEYLIHDERSSELGSHLPVVIAQVGVQDILKNLEKVQIGDEVIVYGSNSAEYKFRVTEIRDMKAEFLPNVIGVNSESIILYKSKNTLRTRVYIVIAKPVK